MRSRLAYVLLFVCIVSGLFLAERYIDKHNITLTTSQSTDANAGLVWDQELLPTSNTGAVVFHEYYTLSYSEKHEQAEWVAYELRDSHITDNELRRPNFEMDPKVRSNSAHWRNYKRSGYDRGHLCPAGDRRFSVDAYNETFLTSNISPQNHDFNSGIWNRLEQKVRRWAKQKDSLFVITGGVLRPGLGTIGSEEVAIPEAFYKVIVTADRESYRVIAFLIPNQPTSNSYFEYTLTVDALEAVSGIDFFPGLPDAQERQLEAADGADWWR